MRFGMNGPVSSSGTEVKQLLAAPLMECLCAKTQTCYFIAATDQNLRLQPQNHVHVKQTAAIDGHVLHVMPVCQKVLCRFF